MANVIQNGVTAKVRYETAPTKGNLTYDSSAFLNHLHGKTKLVSSTCGTNLTSWMTY